MKNDIIDFLDNKKEEKQHKENNLIDIFNRHLTTENKISTIEKAEIAFNKMDKTTQYYILKDIATAADRNFEHETNVSEHDLVFYSRRFRKFSKFSDVKVEEITQEQSLINDLKSELEDISNDDNKSKPKIKRKNKL